jgi:membrane fusion protein, multidrug efflux system
LCVAKKDFPRVIRRHWPIVTAGGVALLVGAGLLFHDAYHGEAAAQSRGAPAPAAPVTAAIAAARDMPVYVRGLGTVQAYNNVSVKSRVDGTIVNVDFTEGQEVKKGDLLFEIDPRPFQAILAQAQASFARDQAQLANAQRNANRDKPLVGKDFISRQQFDTDSTNATVLEATVASDKAAIEAAQLNLDYADIRSPIDGRTGARQVDVGNLVHASDSTALVTITQLKPIFVSFTAPQNELDAIRRAQIKGAVPAEAWSQSEGRQMATGGLTLIDNQIDAATGTIHLKASFDNSDEALWPGEFVDMRLQVETLKNAVTVPSRSIQAGPNGSYLFVIKPDDSVEQRTVTVAETEGDVAVVSKGLSAGEKIVVDGQYRLQQGTKVSILPPQSQPAPAAKG